MDGQALEAQQLIMGQDGQPAEPSVPLGCLQAEGEPVPNAEVDCLANAEAVGEAAVVGAREGDDVLPWCLHHTRHMHTCQQACHWSAYWHDIG